MKFLVLLVALLTSVLARADVAPLDAKATTIKFTGHAFLHDFTGQAQDFEGGAVIDRAQPTFVGAAVVDVGTAGLTTFQETRDRNMRNWLHVAEKPRIEYRLDKLTCDSGVPARATRDHPAAFTVHGYFTLNHATKPLTAQVLGWREDQRLIVTGAIRIDTTAYGLPIIRQLMMTVDKNVDVSFRLVFDLPANLQGPAPAVIP